MAELFLTSAGRSTPSTFGDKLTQGYKRVKREVEDNPVAAAVIAAAAAVALARLAGPSRQIFKAAGRFVRSVTASKTVRNLIRAEVPFIRGVTQVGRILLRPATVAAAATLASAALTYRFHTDPLESAPSVTPSAGFTPSSYQASLQELEASSVLSAAISFVFAVSDIPKGSMPPQATTDISVAGAIFGAAMVFEDHPPSHPHSFSAPLPRSQKGEQRSVPLAVDAASLTRGEKPPAVLRQIIPLALLLTKGVLRSDSGLGERALLPQLSGVALRQQLRPIAQQLGLGTERNGGEEILIAAILPLLREQLQAVAPQTLPTLEVVLEFRPTILRRVQGIELALSIRNQSTSQLVTATNNQPTDALPSSLLLTTTRRITLLSHVAKRPRSSKGQEAQNLNDTPVVSLGLPTTIPFRPLFSSDLHPPVIVRGAMSPTSRRFTEIRKMDPLLDERGEGERHSRGDTEEEFEWIEEEDSPV